MIRAFGLGLLSAVMVALLVVAVWLVVASVVFVADHFDSRLAGAATMFVWMVIIFSIKFYFNED